ncbi:MAG: phosphoenolpyruvate carboxylase [Gammaproteobacteria bacterium]|nr:phosphoenolpyruvate carboxylase [Gammaproteobacteria bacterium]
MHCGRCSGCSPGRRPPGPLPGWYGAGAGLDAAISTHGLDRLREAYASWPFLRGLVDDVEAMLARADLQMSSHYEALQPGQAPLSRADAGGVPAGARVVAADRRAARSCSMAMRRCSVAIQLRNPLSNPCISAGRSAAALAVGAREDRELFDALLATISGIAMDCRAPVSRRRRMSWLALTRQISGPHRSALHSCQRLLRFARCDHLCLSRRGELRELGTSSRRPDSAGSTGCGATPVWKPSSKPTARVTASSISRSRASGRPTPSCATGRA